MHVTSTANCPRTPVLLLALEESERSYQLELVEDGWFQRHHGAPGPLVVDGAHTGLGMDVVLEVLVDTAALAPDPDAARLRDRWIAALRATQGVLARIAEARRSGNVDPADVAALHGFVGEVEAALGARPWLSGDAFGAADVALVPIARMGRFGVPLGPNVRAWLERIRARPAWSRVAAALPTSVVA